MDITRDFSNYQGQPSSPYPQPLPPSLALHHDSPRISLLVTTPGFGFGLHECLGARLVSVSLTASLKRIFSLPNVRRAPGPAGVLKRFHHRLAETSVPVYVTVQGALSPVPSTLSIIYDGEAP